MQLSTLLQELSLTLPSQFERELLSAYVLQSPREKIIAHAEREVSQEQEKNLRDLISARARGMPVAYLTYHKEFYGLEFYVDERVLIPRPETELLVEEALGVVRARPDIRIYDLGTGSGCIAISLSKHAPESEIFALDISTEALAVARKNVATHRVDRTVQLIQSDLLTAVTPELSSTKKPYIIVANLPYIGREESDSVADEVRAHEPHTALFAGESGLELFEKLFSQIQPLTTKPAYILLEIGFSQKDRLTKLVEKYFGEVAVSWKNDLAGWPRICSIKL